jgi:long-chain acyl-CoA synthetase
VAAFVTLKPGAAAGADELSRYCQEHLAHFKFPRHIVIVDELPKGAAGKVIKAELLKGRYWSQSQRKPEHAAYRN